MNMTPVYITDTSVLFWLLQGFGGFGGDRKEEKVAQKAEQLFSGKDRIVIPMHAFLEISEQFFQICIDVGNYEMWYRTRKTVFQNRLLHHLTDSSNRVQLLRESTESYYAANRIMCRIHDVYLKAIVNNKKLMDNSSCRRNPKFLDGMDAAILEEAIWYALQNKQCPCVFVTTDVSFSIAVNNLRDAFPYNESYAPQNLSCKLLWRVRPQRASTTLKLMS